MERLRKHIMNLTIVYIVGRGHSGSTMLELLLNRNPSMAAMGELNLLPLQLYRNGKNSRWTGKCSCGQRPLECPVWGAALNSVASSHKLELRSSPLKLRISDEGLAEEFGWKKPWAALDHRLRRGLRRASQQNNLLSPILSRYVFKPWAELRDTIYSSYAATRGVEILIDASKDYLQMLDLYRFSKHRVKVLYITRDVRGHAWSSIRKKEATATNEAITWQRLNQNILDSLAHVAKEDWLHVKYEDLCSQTDETLAKIFDFVGTTNQQLSPEQELARRHTIAGNATRFRALDTIRQDEKWRENLTVDDILNIKKQAQSTAEALGYTI